MQNNPICQLFNIKYPIVQAGMIWCSGWELAAASANAGILGIIGAGSMYPDVLRTHIQKCKLATDKPFGVNLPLLYPDIETHIQTILEEDVKIVFTSAGNPRTWTEHLKSNGITVVHVVSSAKFAQKAVAAGVDAVVAEGFEAGGHNGREETTTMCLIPEVRDAIDIPLIAAGGIGDGRSMLAAMALGADAVQVGSRFVASAESSAHQAFKDEVIKAGEGSTILTLKEITPVRLIRNKFFEDVQAHYQRCADVEELKTLLGRGRAKKGMFEGNLEEGELEIGQVSSRIRDIKPVAEIVDEFIATYNATRASLQEIS
ncbi:MAG: nitronate monooxygenase [Cryomorphaceae bacterium]|nr:nitronate monooxygenase [Cryomorphaceae bacterium]